MSEDRGAVTIVQIVSSYDPVTLNQVVFRCFLGGRSAAFGYVQAFEGARMPDGSSAPWPFTPLCSEHAAAYAARERGRGR